MTCPSCNYDLQKLSVTTNSGGRFDIDHCGRCGGTWFDPYEINRIPYHEVVRLAQMTVQSKSPDKLNEKLFCPNDYLQFEDFKSDAVPKGVKLLWCRKCLGIWATQKALWEFKKHQESTVEEISLGKKTFPNLSIVFVPTLTLVLLFVSTFATISNLQEQKQTETIASTIVQNLEIKQISEKGAIITFYTDTPVRTELVLGKSILEMEKLTVSDKPSNYHSILLTNLQPGATYFYRIKLIQDERTAYMTKQDSFVLQ